MAIKSFAEGTAYDIFHGINSKDARRVPQNVWDQARRKLALLDAAKQLMDLSRAHGLHFEHLWRDRPGFFSIRINLRYRVIFKWEKGDAYEVSIENYHGRAQS